MSAYEIGEVGNQSTEAKPLSSGGCSIPKRVLLTNQNDSTAFKARKCILCPDKHRLSLSEFFNNISLPECLDSVFKNKLCYNCRFPAHQFRQYRVGNCANCGRRHNTKFHCESLPKPSRSVAEKSPPEKSQEPSAVAYIEKAKYDYLLMK